jgi:hypothetical protein
MIVYLYFVLNLRKNITFYFMFIKEKNKIKDFERKGKISQCCGSRGLFIQIFMKSVCRR